MITALFRNYMCICLMSQMPIFNECVFNRISNQSITMCVKALRQRSYHPETNEGIRADSFWNMYSVNATELYYTLT